MVSPGAGRSRVALIGGLASVASRRPDVRKPLDELKRLFPRDTLALKALLRVFRARKARAAADLLRQLAENGIEVGGKMVAHGLHTHVGHAEVTGEQAIFRRDRISSSTSSEGLGASWSGRWKTPSSDEGAHNCSTTRSSSGMAKGDRNIWLIGHPFKIINGLRKKECVKEAAGAALPPSLHKGSKAPSWARPCPARQ